MARDRRKRQLRKKTEQPPLPPAPPSTEEIVRRVSMMFAEIAPDAIRRISEAEVRARHYQEELKRLQDRLVSILVPDQIEAARTAGIEPWLYAIEFIDCWVRGMISRENTAQIMNIHTLKRW